ncbi:MAG: hypothetical protein ACXVRV_05710, partial [Gaiellaceae bacterium]
MSPKSRSLLRPERRASRREETRAGRFDACDEVRLCLIDGFALGGDPGRKQLPLGAQRVVVFIALHERPLLRGYVAGSLWLDSTEERAAA